MGPVLSFPRFMASRPPAITVVALFLFAAACLAVVVGCVLLFPGAASDWIWKLNEPGAGFFRAAGRSPGLALLALGLAIFFAALGLLRGRPWAWWFAVMLFCVQIAGDIAAYIMIRDGLRAATGIAVPTILLWLLLPAPSRRHCSARPPAPGAH